MRSLNRVTTIGYINETCKIQEIFKEFNRFTKEIKEQSVDEKAEVNWKAKEIIEL
jgi:hypothetical protein